MEASPSNARAPAVAGPAPGPGPGSRRRSTVPHDAARAWSVEVVVGALAIVAVSLGGLLVAQRPWPGPVDRWLQTVVPGSHDPAVVDITRLRYPWVVVGGSILAAALVVRRDRVRAAACVLGPLLAMALCEEVVKPLVGRTLGGGLTYPSGSTTGAAALAAVAVLAVPRRWRWPTVAAAGAFAVWMTVAVVALRWHFPTDALAGAVLGAGVVILVDGASHLARGRWSARRRAPPRRGRGALQG